MNAKHAFFLSVIVATILLSTVVTAGPVYSLYFGWKLNVPSMSGERDFVRNVLSDLRARHPERNTMKFLLWEGEPIRLDFFIQYRNPGGITPLSRKKGEKWLKGLKVRIVDLDTGAEVWRVPITFTEKIYNPSGAKGDLDILEPGGKIGSLEPVVVESAGFKPVFGRMYGLEIANPGEVAARIAPSLEGKALPLDFVYWRPQTPAEEGYALARRAITSGLVRGEKAAVDLALAALSKNPRLYSMRINVCYYYRMVGELDKCLPLLDDGIKICSDAESCRRLRKHRVWFEACLTGKCPPLGWEE